MASLNRYYYLLKDGQNTINSPKFSNVDILGVRRGGFEMEDVTESDPVGNQFSKPFSSSIMTFDPANPGADGGEKVWVLIKGESPPEPLPDPPVTDALGGYTINQTYPLTGNRITLIKYDGNTLTMSPYLLGGASGYPIEAIVVPTASNGRRFNVPAAAVNKVVEVTVEVTALRRINILDSALVSQTMNAPVSGVYSISGVTIDGINEVQFNLDT